MPVAYSLWRLCCKYIKITLLIVACFFLPYTDSTALQIKTFSNESQCSTRDKGPERCVLNLARLFGSVGPPHQPNPCILHSIRKGWMAWIFIEILSAENIQGNVRERFVSLSFHFCVCLLFEQQTIEKVSHKCRNDSSLKHFAQEINSW